MAISKSVLAGLVAIAAVAICSDASADSAALSDFRSLCMETGAVPLAAFAAADAVGWITPQPGTIDFAGLSGNPDGRVINQGTTTFRAFSAGESSNSVQDMRKCVLVAQEAFDLVAAELEQAMPVQAGQRGEQHLTWTYVTLDGAFRSLHQMSTQDAVRAGQSREPFIEVSVVRTTGGVVLAYQERRFRPRS